MQTTETYVHSPFSSVTDNTPMTILPFRQFN